MPADHPRLDSYEHTTSSILINYNITLQNNTFGSKKMRLDKTKQTTENKK